MHMLFRPTGRIKLFTLLLLASVLISIVSFNSMHAHADDSPQSQLQQLIAQNNLIAKSIYPPKGIRTHEYVTPAYFYDMFDWDTYFMSVASSYDNTPNFRAAIQGTLENYLDQMDSSGNIPDPYSKDFSGPLQKTRLWKPFMAQLALQISLNLNDFSWVQGTYYSKLQLLINDYETTRLADDGLFYWYDSLESGCDNNAAIPGGYDVVQGVDLNSYMYREYLAMATLANTLGHPDDATSYTHKAGVLLSTIRAKMWDESDQSFYNIYQNDPHTPTGFIRVNSWTNLTPLWAGVATQDQADKMINAHVLNTNEFWANNGIRTLAANDPSYNPTSGYWRGPVWGNSNWIVMQGLNRYGYNTQAIDLANKTVNVLLNDIKTNGTFNENYNPETGTPTGAEGNVGWNLLGAHIVDEATNKTDPSWNDLTPATPQTPGQTAAITSVNWPSSIAATGSVNVTVNYQVNGTDTLEAILWDGNYNWEGTVTVTVTTSGTTTLTVPDYSGITTGKAFMRISLLNGSTVLAQAENDSLSVS